MDESLLCGCCTIQEHGTTLFTRNKKLKKSMSERSLADAVHEYKKVEMKQAGMHGHSNKSIKTLCSYLTSK